PRVDIPPEQLLLREFLIVGQQFQSQICSLYGIHFLSDQHSLFVESRSRPGESQCHEQTEYGEQRTLDRPQVASVGVRLLSATANCEKTSCFEQDEHAEKQQ